MANITIKDLAARLHGLEKSFAEMQVNPRMKFAAEAEWVLQSCEKNDYATKAALADPGAVEAALLNVAAVGVTLDPARKLAYILPRDDKMVYDLSYMGLIDVAITSGAIKWAQARRVYDKDVFELTGFDAPPLHKCNPFAKPDARGAVIGAYVVVKTADGDYLTNTMPIDEINAIRDRSPAWKSRKANNPRSGGPWATDEGEMQKKTVVKNAYKYWPRSEALDRAIHYLNTDGGQGIDLTPEDEARTAASVADAWVKDVKAATSGDEVAALWHKARQDDNLKANPDAYQKVRDAVAAKNRELGVKPPENGNKPAATPAPTPAPSPAPAARGSQALSAAGKVLAAIDKAETYEELEATGPAIDALPEGDQAECNDAYNQRLEYLKSKFGDQ